MSKKVQTDIQTLDIAVKLEGVTKSFEQWIRRGNIKDSIKNLFKSEKRILLALDNISFEIKKGEFVAYAGPNGAGKSTTMKLLSGMLLPMKGDIEVLGLSPNKDRIKLMKDLGILFGNRTELWWDHPIISSFEWKRVVWGIPKDEFIKTRDMVIELLDISDIINTFARELSLGQRMRADLALMLLHNPKIILLDEPTLGLDVLAKRKMINFLKNLNKEFDTTIIVTSHDMDDLEEMAERILLISNGKIAFDGDFEGLRELTGNLQRIIINTKDKINLNIKFGELVSNNDNMFVYEFDSNKIHIRDVLYEMSRLEGEFNLEIKKAPIEDVISNLYIKWKNK
ncbi:MAG: ATP-binding cassette domain-containing protein [Clostridiales bacterium]